MTSDRNLSHWASFGNPVPQFYAPVTVHPVTVNVDNSGLIREISRLHERLNSLTGVNPQPEVNVVETANADPSRVTTSKTQSESVIEPLPTRIVYEVRAVDTMRPSPEDSGEVAQVQTATTETIKNPEPVKTDQSGRLKEPVRIVERLPVLDQTAPVTISLSGPRPKTQVPVFESEPELKSVAAESESIPRLEFSFELVPTQQEPGRGQLEPLSSVPKIEETATIESKESSTGLSPVPLYEATSESIPRLPPIQLIPAPSPFSQSRFDVPRNAILPSPFPELVLLSSLDRGASKRTTDPLFMNGRVARDSNLQNQTPNKRIYQIQRMSGTVEDSQALANPQKSSSPSGTACNAIPGDGKPSVRPKAMLRLLAPSEMLRHVRTLFQK